MVPLNLFRTVFRNVLMRSHAAKYAACVVLACAAAVVVALPVFGQTTGTVTLIGAGDIARCDLTHDEQTAQLIGNILGSVSTPYRVITLGDNAYPSGTNNNFANCYDNYKLDGSFSTYNASRKAWWGQFKAQTMPSLGNHEYLNSTNPSTQSKPYFDYFSGAVPFKGPTAPVPNTTDNPGLIRGDPGSGDAKGYYSYNLGSWHIVVLNSNCDYVSCDSTSSQADWLRNDLASHPAKCTLAYMHHPLYATGTGGLEPRVKPLWQILYDNGADVILNGHDHRYERLARIGPNDNKDLTNGMRPIIAGTGGDPGTGTTATNEPNSEIKIFGTAGVLKMDLSDGYYSWAFIATDGTANGKVIDSTAAPADPKFGAENPPNSTTPPGTEACHGAPGSTDTTPPTLTGIAPADGATGVAVKTNAEATFSEAMDSSTINGSTFTLVKQGTTTPISATVTYDPTTKKATLTPSSALEAGVIYTATVKGGTGGVKDLAGNALATDTAWSFTTRRKPHH